MVIRPLTQRLLQASAAKSVAASGALHLLAAGAIVYWSQAVPREPTEFRGRSQVIQMQLTAEQPAREEMVHELMEPPPAQPVVITPQFARLEKRHLTETPGRDVVLDWTPPVSDTAEIVPVSRSAEFEQEPPSTTPQPPEEIRVERRPSHVVPQVASVAAPPPQTLGTNDRTPPIFAGNRPPHYPDMARVNRWQGTVLLLVRIAADGRVYDVQVLESSGHAILDAEAIRAVRQWKGEPARLGGQPIATEERLPVRFRL